MTAVGASAGLDTCQHRLRQLAMLLRVQKQEPIYESTTIDVAMTSSACTRRTWLPRRTAVTC